MLKRNPQKGLFLNEFKIVDHNVSLFKGGKEIGGITLWNPELKIINFFHFEYFEDTIKEVNGKFHFIITIYPTREYIDSFINSTKEILPSEIPLFGVVGGSSRTRNYLCISDRPFNFFITQPVVPLYRVNKKRLKDLEMMKLKEISIFVEKGRNKNGFLFLDEYSTSNSVEEDVPIYISGRYLLRSFLDKHLREMEKGVVFIDSQYKDFVWDKDNIIFVSVPGMFFINVDGFTGFSSGVILGMGF